MSYQVLARKWRPATFNELVGQEHVMRALVNALDNDRLHHAYLFTGTRGVGKTTIARILARSLNCDNGVSSTPCGECSACTEIAEGRFVDLIEVDAASRTRVEDTRELLENVQYAPTRGRYKVYLIDEVHMLSGHSFNALLKTLEEPPPHVKFLLATTDPQRLPVTILSRCLQFNLKSLTVPQISGQLNTILEAEQVEAEEGAVRQLAIAANGSMRDALSLMDQAIAYGDGKLVADDVQNMLGTIDRAVIYRLVQALAAGDANGLMQEIAAADDFAPDYATLLADILTLLQRIAIARTIPDALDDSQGDEDAVRELADALSDEDVQLYYQIGLLGRRDLPLSPEPRGGFEMVMLRMLAFRPAEADQPAGGMRATTPRKASVSKQPAANKAASKPASKHASKPAAQPEARQTDKQPAGAADPEWAGIIEAMNLRGILREMASNMAFHGVEDDIVRLSIDATSKQLYSKARQADLEQALSTHYQRKLCIRLVDDTKGEVESPARKRQRESDTRQQQAVASIEEDANLKSITDTFGGTVFTESIRPTD